MPYDPGSHQRRSIRLQGYDYAQAGAYFVTIVTHRRECLFGDATLRRVAESMWQRIPHHFRRVLLDECIVMPNHVHGILLIADPVPEGDAFPSQRPVDGEPDPTQVGSAAGTGARECVAPTGGPSRGSLGAIVGNYKSVTARRINHIRRTPGVPVWQRNYHERVIRNQRELDAIREYIVNNSLHWEIDRENPDHVGHTEG